MAIFGLGKGQTTSYVNSNFYLRPDEEQPIAHNNSLSRNKKNATLLSWTVQMDFAY